MAKLFFVGLDGTEKSYRLQTHRPFTVGRDPGNDIILRDPKVSRHHAEITLRGDKFLLVDRSTNGTFVYTDAGDSFRVIREELALGGSGRILPGGKALEPIRYRLGRYRIGRR